MKVCEVSKDFSLDNVVPFFQPIMDVQQNVVWGYECLARLIQHGDRTFLPAEFLYLVEKESCVGELTRRIFHQSAEYFRHRQVNWSINITEKDVLDPNTTAFLQRYLQDYPNAHRVTLELCAHTVVYHPEEFKTFLLLCKALDIQLIIDRFSGLTSHLEAVLDFPIDGVKLDGNLIVQLCASEETRDLLGRISQKAKQNEIAIIAEHIEDDRTYAAITALDIQYGQGFHISHPQSAVA